MAITVDKAAIGTPVVSISNATTIAIVTNQIVAAGALIVLTIGGFNPTQTLNSVAGGSLTWTIDKQGHSGAPASINPAIVSAPAPAGLASGITITATWNVATASHTIGGISFLGADVSGSRVDGTPVGPTGVSPAATGWTTPSYTIAAGSVIVGTAWQETANTTSTITAPTNEFMDVTHANGFGQTSGYRIEPSAGSYTVGGAFVANVQSTTVGVAYKAAAVAGGGRGKTARRIRSRSAAISEA